VVLWLVTLVFIPFGSYFFIAGTLAVIFGQAGSMSRDAGLLLGFSIGLPALLVGIAFIFVNRKLSRGDKKALHWLIWINSFFCFALFALGIWDAMNVPEPIGNSEVYQFFFLGLLPFALLVYTLLLLKHPFFNRSGDIALSNAQ
jgi:hypothetical protein